MTTSIDLLWNRLAEGPVAPAQTRVAGDHPLDLFAQVDELRRVGLLAISDAMPERPPAYAAVEIVLGRRNDGRWATSISLAQPGLLPLFTAMCDQIVEQGRDTPPGTSAAAYVLAQVARRHRLLALGRDGLLSMEEQQGLFGELEVLRQAVTRYGPAAAALGWKGPDDEPQDFQLPEGMVEVKTVQPGAPAIGISSLERLDIDDGRLSVAVIDLVRCVAGTGGTSLAQSVSSLRDLLTPDPGALQRFEEQLQRAGYMDRAEYEDAEYRISRARWFIVRPEFPRLVRSRMPAAVAGARYQLLLGELVPFETDPFPQDGRS